MASRVAALGRRWAVAGTRWSSALRAGPQCLAAVESEPALAPKALWARHYYGDRAWYTQSSALAENDAGSVSEVEDQPLVRLAGQAASVEREQAAFVESI